MASGHTDEQPLNFFPAFLGWVFPGLGQIVLGERRRGFLAMGGVLLLFFSGILVGGIDAVDKDEDRLWFAGQACAGPIAFVAAFANESLLKSGRMGELLDTPSGGIPPTKPGEHGKISSRKGLAHPNEFGTLFCFLAGLMNLVIVLDAFNRMPAEAAQDRRAGDGKARA